MERREVWLYRLLLPTAIVVALLLFSVTISTQTVALLFQLLVTLFGVLFAIVISDWFRVETKADDAFELKRALRDELKKSHDRIESDPFGMLYLDIWEIGRAVGSLGYLTRTEQSEYGIVYGSLRSYLLLVEEYNRIQMSGIFHGTKGIISKKQKDLLKEIEAFLDSHEELTFLEKLRKRLGR